MTTFPSLLAHDLDGREVRIPDDLPAGPRIVILAFERWQQELVDTWEPVLGRLEERCRALSVWEVPTLSRLYLPARGFIDGGMRAGIPDPDARRHTLTAYTDVHAAARALDLPTTSTVYLLLLSPDGTVLWRGQGAADDPQAEALTRALESMACDT